VERQARAGRFGFSNPRRPNVLPAGPSSPMSEGSPESACVSATCSVGASRAAESRLRVRDQNHPRPKIVHNFSPKEVGVTVGGTPTITHQLPPLTRTTASRPFSSHTTTQDRLGSQPARRHHTMAVQGTVLVFTFITRREDDRMRLLRRTQRVGGSSFRYLTIGSETYPRRAFLYSPKPVEGKVCSDLQGRKNPCPARFHS